MAEGAHERWYSSWAPKWAKPQLARFWPEDQPISWEALIDKLDHAVQIPSYANAWLFPIRTRIDMITTGIRTPVGVKVMGPKLETIEDIGLQVEKTLQGVAGTRSAFFERVTGGYYIDYQVKRAEAARYNLSVAQVNQIIEAAVGGVNVTTTVEGRERYPVNVRYARGLRDDLSKLSRVMVPTPDGAQVPISELADLTVRSGAPMIKNEEGFLAGFVYVDTKDGISAPMSRRRSERWRSRFICRRAINSSGAANSNICNVRRSGCASWFRSRCLSSSCFCTSTQDHSPKP